MHHYIPWRRPEDSVRIPQQDQCNERTGGGERSVHRRSGEHREVHRTASAPWSHGERQLCGSTERVVEHIIVYLRIPLM